MTMDEVAYSTELTKIHHTNYVRNSRAIAVLWGVFVVICTILIVVVFIEPQWFGDTGDSNIPGYFGLWKRCHQLSDDSEASCKGSFLDFKTIGNASFQAASFFVGVAALFFFVSVFCFLLFFFLNTATVLKICGWFQIIAAVLMLLGCIIFPNGWDHVDIRKVCGIDSGSYDIGVCGLRWGYILAIILIFDEAILAILAFVLAAKQARLLPGVYKKEKDSKK
ncbi:LHFPL tetraspan subfamily member 3 protein-like isoform X2 [Babylonia areolata]|uniref:LHFPL tetraspan subfamily member 3 protein-like isoform X2 n=1 Tax=Babylonia areolata TaxID=304850 RepID=UPI003FD470DF